MPTQPPQDAATHRLARIIVQEVSLVDRAANKRRFLVVKRDETTMPNAKTPVIKDNAAAATAAIADQTAEAGSTPEAGPGAAEAGGATEVIGSGMQQQVKEALTSALADVAEKIVAIANQVDKIDATDQPVTPAVPEEIMSQIADVAKSLGEVSAKFGGGAAEGSGSIAASAAGAPGPAPTPETEKAAAAGGEPTEEEKAAVQAAESEVTKKGLPLAKHGDLVTKSVAKRLGVEMVAAKAVVAKVGRRMAKKRMEQLGKAIDMLVGLMKELRYENQKSAQKSSDSAVTKAAESGQPVKSSPEIDVLLSSAEQLLEVAKAQGTELETAKAALAMAHAKIAKLEKTTGGSNVIPLEKSGGGEAGGSVAWPWDMNGRGPRSAAAK